MSIPQIHRGYSLYMMDRLIYYRPVCICLHVLCTLLRSLSISDRARLCTSRCDFWSAFSCIRHCVCIFLCTTVYTTLIMKCDALIAWWWITSHDVEKGVENGHRGCSAATICIRPQQVALASYPVTVLAVGVFFCCC